MNETKVRETIEGRKFKAGAEIEIFKRKDGHGWRRSFSPSPHKKVKAVILERYVTFNGPWRNPAYFIEVIEGPLKGKKLRVQ